MLVADQSANLHGRLQINTSRDLNAKNAPSAWRFIVLPSRARQAAATDATIMRTDAAHSTALNPNLIWTTAIGIMPEMPALSEALRSGAIAELAALESPRSNTFVDSSTIAASNNARIDRSAARIADRLSSVLSGKTSGGMPSEGGEAAAKVDEQYRSLLAEAAHDIRSPLGVAQQIIARIASRVRTTGAVPVSELRLLESASERLQQASKWCDGILMPERIDRGRPIPVRERFYPHQLLTIVAPVVDSFAKSKSVQLNWIGWDLSLPRLYLDSSQLARVLVNLINNAIEASTAGSQLSVRIAWQTNVTQRLVIAIEDEGRGLDNALLKFLNSAHSDAPKQAGIGLATVKSLVASFGGALSAQVNQSGGTLLRVTLPVDNRLALVRNWLVQSAERVAKNHDQYAGRIQLHVLRSSGVDPALADQLLQQSASTDDFAYRIADDRWLWLSIIPAQSNNAGRSGSHARGAVERLSAQLTERMAVESGRLNCQLAFEWNDIDLCGLHNSLNQRNLLPQLSASIADKFAQLIGTRVAPINELNRDMVSAWCKNVDLDSASNQRPVVRQRASSNLRVDTADQKPLADKRHTDAPQAAAKENMLANSLLNADPSQFAELAQDWTASPLPN